MQLISSIALLVAISVNQMSPKLRISLSKIVFLNKGLGWTILLCVGVSSGAKKEARWCLFDWSGFVCVVGILSDLVDGYIQTDPQRINFLVLLVALSANQMAPKTNVSLSKIEVPT